MMRKITRILLECFGGAGLLLLAATMVRAEGPRRHVIPPTTGVITQNSPREIKLSEYWIGLDCRPVDPALRMHLKLAEGEGILVYEIVPDTPSHKAGLQPYDLLLKADETRLTGIHDLIGVVDATKDGQFVLELLRAGEPITVTVKPAKRPPMPRMSPEDFPPNLQGMDTLRKWLEENAESRQGTMRFRMLHPGVILPPGAEVIPAPQSPSTSAKPAPDRVEQRLNEMNRQIRALRESLEELIEQNRSARKK